MSKTKTWYAITENAGQAADVHIYDYIGEWGVTARGFIAELKAVDATQINLHINSPGGSIVDGVAIQNSLKQHPATVTTHIDGLAGSIASIIALAGDDVQIADNAYVMIHNPASIVFGEASDMLKEAEVLDKMADGIASDYAKKMDITTEEARSLMDEETWYLGQEAVDAGYADSIYTGTQAVASFDAKRFSANAPAEAIKRFTQSPSGGISNPSANLNPKENNMPDDSTTTETEAASVEPTVEDVVETATEEVVETATEAVASVAEVDVETRVQEALANERKRTAEITAVGNKFGFTEDAEKHIAKGGSIEDFRAHILNKSPDAWKASLAVKNPATQASEEDDSDEGKEAVAKVKERRKARMAG